jgi:hypothetical protein
MDRRQERKHIKQQLFRIRRHVEGEPVKLDKELRDLKKKYEVLPGFTSWSDFPDKWDIGDPYGVKTNAFAFDEIVAENFRKAKGKPYETIVKLTQGSNAKALLGEWHLELLKSGLDAVRYQPEDSLRLGPGHLVVDLGPFEDGDTCSILHGRLHCLHQSHDRFGLTFHVVNPRPTNHRLNVLEQLEILTTSEAILESFEEVERQMDAFYVFNTSKLTIFKHTLINIGLISNLN